MDRAARASLIALAIAASCGGEPEADRAPRLPDRSAYERAIASVARGLPPIPDDGATGTLVIEDPSGRAFAGLERALERAARGEGPARIAAYGGSHTASDLWTGTIREHLQRAFGSAGHGFVLPVPPIDDYWQHGVRVGEAEGWSALTPSSKRTGVEHYGIAGVAFEARGVAWAEVRTERSTASRIELLYLEQPGGGSLTVEIDGVPHHIATDRPRPAAASQVFAVPDGSHTIALRAEGTGPVWIYGLVLEREVSGVVVDQLSIQGTKARHQLLWDQTSWLPLLRTRAPDLFIVSYGNNELDDEHLGLAEHRAHFEQMLARLRRHFPESSCLVLGTFDRLYPVTADGGAATEWRSPPMLPELSGALREVALGMGCGFVDVLGWQGGPGAMERWLSTEPPLARDDRIHLTEPGYRRFGAALLRAMLEALSREP